MTRRIVIAPDSFKGTIDAADAARAIEEGWRTVHPDDDVLLRPMADGGEGTVDAFAVAREGAERRRVLVTGPDDRPVEADWLLYHDPAGRLTGLVELANTSGITLLDPLRPFTAHTRGFGQAIAAALAAGVERLALAIGGSSSTDGGAGALAELGARLLDVDGRPVPDGVDGLALVASVDLDDLVALPPAGASVLTDVTNPLLGPLGAVAVFGRQKGILDVDAPRAEAAVARWGELLADATGVDPATPGAGAAGGTGFGLLAWGAELERGSPAVGAELGLPEAVVGADVVITGEGRYDGQSEAGKVPAYVRGLAEGAGARTALVAGAIAADASAFDAHASLTVLAGSTEKALARPREHLVAAGAALARALAG